MSDDWGMAGRPAVDDEDAIRRRQIEEMMRSERERYFRDEAIQQEYRDIVDRQIAAQQPASEAVAKPAASPEAYYEALARFRETGTFFADDLEDDAIAPLGKEERAVKPASQFPKLPSVDTGAVPPAQPNGVRVASADPKMWLAAGDSDKTANRIATADPYDQDAIIGKAVTGAAQANETLILRRDDPARAVENSLAVRGVSHSDSPDRPAKIIDARHRAQMEKSITDPQPITRAEAKVIAETLRAAIGDEDRALDELASWRREIERRGDDSRGIGQAETKSRTLPRFLEEEKEPERPMREPVFRGALDKSLNLPRAFLERTADPFPGKPPETLPFEAAVRANNRYYRDLSRSRQDIPAALDRTEGTFGAGSKFYKQTSPRREEEARKELRKRHLDVAYKLTREEQEKVDPFGVYSRDLAWAILNGATHPLDALVGRAAGLPSWTGGLVGKYAPDAAKKVAGSLFQGPAGKAAKAGGAYVAGAGAGGAVADGVEQGLKMITGEQKNYSAKDTLKATRDGVVEEAVKDSAKAGYERYRQWLRGGLGKKR